MDKGLRRKNRIKCSFALGLLCVNLLFLWAAVSSPPFCERYLIPAGYYLLLPIKKLVDLLPFSLSEFSLVVLLPVALIYCISWAIRRVWNKKAGSFKSFFSGFALVLSLLYLLYNLALGFPAHRSTLSETMRWNPSPNAEETLVRLTEELAKQANTERAAFSVDWPGYKSLNTSLMDAYRTSSALYPFVLKQPSVPKRVLLSVPMSYTQTSGIFIPFFAESNVNIDEPFYAYPFTAAHEMAHSVLVSRESDANMTAFLVCREAKLPEVRYSADFFGILYCFTALAEVNPQEVKRIYASLSPQVQEDYLEYGEHVRKYEGKVADLSQKLNDLYIKSTGQPEGVESYGEVVDQMILWYANR